VSLWSVVPIVPPKTTERPRTLSKAIGAQYLYGGEGAGVVCVQADPFHSHVSAEEPNPPNRTLTWRKLS
jgi:hypothetical protein